jgi:hypothetical protein
MNILTKLLGVFAGGLFIAWMVFTFLGLDSEQRPSTMRMMNAGEICLAASLILFLIRFIFLRRQKQHKDV